MPLKFLYFSFILFQSISSEHSVCILTYYNEFLVKQTASLHLKLLLRLPLFQCPFLFLERLLFHYFILIL